MKRSIHPFVCIGLAWAASWASAAVALPATSGAARVPFVENVGQVDRRYAFTASTSAGSIGVTRRGDIVYATRGDNTSPVSERLSSRRLRPRGADSAPTRVSYFVGADPARWKSDIATWSRVSLGQPWPGIDLDLRANAGTVEKVFRLAPGSDPGKIRIRVEGAGLRIDADGSLLVLDAGRAEGALRFSAPAAWEDHGGETRPVPVAYRVRGKSYGFELGPHDPSFPIVIDPLVQSTYFGGTGADQILSLAFDPGTGDVYGAGLTTSTDLPGTAGGAQPAHGVDTASSDAFVAHWNAGLTMLLQATYLGGSGFDSASTVVVYPGTGDIYIAGGSGSPDLPQTSGAAHTARNGGSDGFLSRFNSTLTTLKRTTYIGGINLDNILAMGVHPTTGELYVVGDSSGGLPEAVGGAQNSGGNAFAARVSTDLSSIPQATYIGGGGA